MNEQLKEDLSSIEAILGQVTQYGVAYLKNIAAHYTSAENTPINAEDLPRKGIGAIEALKKFNTRWAPALVAASGPVTGDL